MQVKTIFKKIIEAIKDEIEVCRWHPEVHDITNSKCIEFSIKLCLYCRTKQYNTCLIQCNKQNILMAQTIIDGSPEEYIRVGIKPSSYRDYSLWMLHTIKHYFPEYEYLIYQEYEELKQ